MGSRMNWAGVRDRDRIRKHGGETVKGKTLGSAAVPSVPAEMPQHPRRGKTLVEPVVVERFWANRQHDAFVITLSTYKGHNLVDLRKHAMDASGRLVPTPKGVALKVTRLRDLAKAVNKAVARAVELGLIDEAGE